MLWRSTGQNNQCIIGAAQLLAWTTHAACNAVSAGVHCIYVLPSPHVVRGESCASLENVVAPKSSPRTVPLTAIAARYVLTAGTGMHAHHSRLHAPLALPINAIYNHAKCNNPSAGNPHQKFDDTSRFQAAGANQCNNQQIERVTPTAFRRLPPIDAIRNHAKCNNSKTNNLPDSGGCIIGGHHTNQKVH